MVDVVTVMITAIFTGLGVSIGNVIFELYLKDHFKKWKRHQRDHLQRIKRNLRSKRPWLAALLNFFVWGSGYVYLKRKIGMGILLLFVWFFVWSGFWISENALTGEFEGFTYFFLTMVISGYLAYDAHKAAQDAERR